MPAHGDTVDEFRVGTVEVTVRHSCIRRDMYELRRGESLPSGVVDRLRARGQVKADSPALLIVEVPGVHRLTVAPNVGRVVVMPKLATERPDQREAAVAVAELNAAQA